MLGIEYGASSEVILLHRLLMCFFVFARLMLIILFFINFVFQDIARTSHAHPTLMEAVKEAAMLAHGKAIHF